MSEFFQLFLLMAQASFKQQTRTKLAIASNVITPTVFATIFASVILLIYRIKPQPFVNLPLASYFVCFFASQIILFLVFDRSLWRLRRAILSGDIDTMLLRPVNFLFFKYIRHLDIQIPYILTYSFIGMFIASSYAHVDGFSMVKLLLFIVIASIIRSNSIAIINGLSFFSRDQFGVGGIYGSLNTFTESKPPEIFPTASRFILTYLLPFIVFQGYIFNLIRGYDDWLFWINCIFWLALSLYGNHLTWEKGLKRYESLG